MYICEGIFDLYIYVAVTSPYLRDRGVTYGIIILIILIFLEKNVPQPQLLAQRYHDHNVFGRTANMVAVVFMRTVIKIAMFFVRTAIKVAVPAERVSQLATEVQIPLLLIGFYCIKTKC